MQNRRNPGEQSGRAWVDGVEISRHAAAVAKEALRVRSNLPIDSRGARHQG